MSWQNPKLLRQIESVWERDVMEKLKMNPEFKPWYELMCAVWVSACNDYRMGRERGLYEMDYDSLDCTKRKSKKNYETARAFFAGQGDKGLYVMRKIDEQVAKGVRFNPDKHGYSRPVEYYVSSKEPGTVMEDEYTMMGNSEY